MYGSSRNVHRLPVSRSRLSRVLVRNSLIWRTSVERPDINSVDGVREESTSATTPRIQRAIQHRFPTKPDGACRSAELFMATLLQLPTSHSFSDVVYATRRAGSFKGYCLGHPLSRRKTLFYRQHGYSMHEHSSVSTYVRAVA